MKIFVLNYSKQYPNLYNTLMILYMKIFQKDFIHQENQKKQKRRISRSINVKKLIIEVKNNIISISYFNNLLFEITSNNRK